MAFTEKCLSEYESYHNYFKHYKSKHHRIRRQMKDMHVDLVWELDGISEKSKDCACLFDYAPDYQCHRKYGNVFTKM